MSWCWSLFTTTKYYGLCDAINEMIPDNADIDGIVIGLIEEWRERIWLPLLLRKIPADQWSTLDEHLPESACRQLYLDHIQHSPLRFFTRFCEPPTISAKELIKCYFLVSIH